MQLLGPENHLNRFIVFIEDVRTQYSNADGVARSFRIGIDPRGLAQPKNNIPAHEAAHVLQFLQKSGGMPTYGYGGERLAEGLADFFATAFEVDRSGPVQNVGI